MQAQQVLVTSNVIDINVPQFFEHPAAVYRRLGYQIILEVKPEYRSLSGGLDSEKANHVDDAYPDWWNITIRKPHMVLPIIPNSSSDPEATKLQESVVWKYELLDGHEMVDVGMVTFLKWYGKVVSQHFAGQTKMLESKGRINSVKLCEHKLPHEMCDLCTQVREQAGTDTLPRQKPISQDGRLRAFWNEMTWANAVAIPTAIALHVLLRCAGKDESGYFVQKRSIIADKVRLVWDAARLILSFVLPFFLVARFWAMPLISLMYAVLHPVDTVFVLFGNTPQYASFCTSLSYLYDASVLYLSIRCDEYAIAMRHLGKMTKSWFGGTVLCLLVLYSLYKMLSWLYDFIWPVKEQGQAHSFGRPFDVKGEKESLYARPRTELDILDIPRHSLSLKGQSVEAISNFFGTNLYYIVAGSTEQKEGSAGNCLFIKGHIALVHSHVIGESDPLRVVVTRDAFAGATSRASAVIDRGAIQPLGDHLSLVYLPNVPLRKSLTMSLPQKQIRQYVGKGFMLKRTRDGTITARILNRLRYVDSWCTVRHGVWVYSTSEPTKDGDCGSLIFADTPSGPVLVGLHQYGNERTGEAAATDLTSLEEFIVS